jgi:hypothetical protein
MPDCCDWCWLAGKEHHFGYQIEPIVSNPDDIDDVFGCGILLNPENKAAIFFTLNGILLGNFIK